MPSIPLIVKNVIDDLRRASKTEQECFTALLEDPQLSMYPFSVLKAYAHYSYVAHN